MMSRASRFFAAEAFVARRRRVSITLATLAYALLMLKASAGAPPSEAPDVATIAGTGAIGTLDGPALSATFMMPVGLARAPGGALYISDQAAQRIRVLDHGDVRTVAGSGAIAPPGLSVVGGYRDGPALQAQFNQPTGLAFGPNGALFIADSFNGCVRRLDHDTVSTVVGRCGDRRAIDGPIADARLKDPRALAFDRAGNLYIADFDDGVRKLDRSGQVSSVHFKAIGDRRIWGITIGGGAGEETLVATSPDWLIIDHLDTGGDEAINLIGSEGNRPFGKPGQLASVDHREYIFTDLRSSVVRYLRLPAALFATTAFSRTIAGGRLERQNDNIGFSDGSYLAARFFAPTGIAIAGNVAYVADTGNRRIRQVELPHFRLPESGLADVAPYDAAHYNVAYIGASWAYWDSLNGDSLCGHLEDGLDKAHYFPKPVRCHPIRIDAATFGQMENYLLNYVPEGVDMVVLNMTGPEVASLFPNSAPPSTEAAITKLKERLVSIRTRLDKRTKLVLFWTHSPDDISLAENLYERALDPGRRNLPDQLIGNYTNFVALFITAGKSVGIPECDTYDGFIEHEKEVDAGALYGTDDSHLSILGSTLAANLLARCLEAGVHP